MFTIGIACICVFAAAVLWFESGADRKPSREVRAFFGFVLLAGVAQIALSLAMWGWYNLP